ncbi:hypothetical protein CEXT_565481 [Caerostris extrusa]|uniref:Uncharacterized protein n=1 Tax=Caerostris extrusa TaxID=172846 RepID=A0AAV4QXY6_CAEEX|nr:hypothetical protein CEXT_565481 [Caerostris extrusa]
MSNIKFNHPELSILSSKIFYAIFFHTKKSFNSFRYLIILGFPHWLQTWKYPFSEFLSRHSEPSFLRTSNSDVQKRRSLEKKDGKKGEEGNVVHWSKTLLHFDFVMASRICSSFLLLRYV